MVGLILVGGVDSILRGVFVKKIIPNSPAHKYGKFLPGDGILAINNLSMDHATHNMALQALQQSPPYVHLLVFRDLAVCQSVAEENEGVFVIGGCVLRNSVCVCLCAHVCVY